MAAINKTALLAALSTLACVEQELTREEAARIDISWAKNGRENLVFLRGGPTDKAVLFGNCRWTDRIVVYVAPAVNFDEHNLPFDSEEFDDIDFQPGEYLRAASHIVETLFPGRDDGELAALQPETHCRECGASLLTYDSDCEVCDPEDDGSWPEQSDPPEMVDCADCGTQIQRSSTNCYSCGFEQPRPTNYEGERTFSQTYLDDVCGPRQTAEEIQSFDSNGNPSDGAQGWYCESCTGTNPMPQDHFCCETPGCYGRLEVTGRFQY